MKFAKLKKTFSYFWLAKKKWKRPKSAKVLIYDREGANYIHEYVDKEQTEILDVRGESINCYVLLALLFTGKFSKSGYRRKYIEFVKPLVAITFIDNSPGFFRLNKLVPDLPTIFLQNGYRGELGDIFSSLMPSNDYFVDYMLVFGNAIGRKYNEYIRGNFLPIGSFKNNVIPERSKPLPKNSNTILFLSQYIKPPENRSSPFWVEPDGRAIYWEDFYLFETALFAFLKKYCGIRNIKIKICGRLDDSDKLEFNFYKSLLDDSDWEFIPNENPFSSYSQIDENEKIVYIDSTLGYEAFGRGKKVACFSIRFLTFPNDDKKYNWPFGWPANLPDSGPFWTNHADEKEFERVMDYLITVDDEQWDKMRTKYKKEIMEYDPGNTLFINLMKKLNVPLKEGI